MTEELLDTVTEVVNSEMVEGIVENLNELEIPVDIELSFEEVQDVLSEYSRGALHATTAIGAGFSVYKLLKNRKKIKNTITTFINKNKEALEQVKTSKPEIVERVDVEAK